MSEPEISIITPVKGTHQSPIHLQKKQAIHASLGTVVLKYPDPLKGRFVLGDEETHKHAHFAVENGERGNLVFAGHSAKLVAIHFHSPSEHWIDGKKFETEFHFVHEIIDYPGTTDAVVEPSSKLVIGFFATAKDPIEPCTKTDTTNPHAFATRLNQFLKAQKEGKVEGKCEEVDLPDRLPTKIMEACREFFYYRGSLTSFSYDETVTWLVPTAVIETENSFLKEVQNTKQATRSIQLLNRRVILLSNAENSV
jgi:carbonic anhydrase